MELSAVPRRGRAGLFSHSLKPPFICPQQMGPPGPPARLHLPCLMRSASFILISEQVPEHNHLTYRWPQWLVHLHKVPPKTTAHYSAVVRCGLQVVKTSLFCPRSAGGRHTGTMTDLVLLSCTIFFLCVWDCYIFRCFSLSFMMIIEFLSVYFRFWTLSHKSGRLFQSIWCGCRRTSNKCGKGECTGYLERRSFSNIRH